MVYLQGIYQAREHGIKKTLFIKCNECYHFALLKLLFKFVWIRHPFGVVLKFPVEDSQLSFRKLNWFYLTLYFSIYFRIGWFTFSLSRYTDSSLYCFQLLCFKKIIILLEENQKHKQQ